MTYPVALTIAGSDPTGGAGLQADLKTFMALGVYGASVTTAITAQNAQRFEVYPVTAEAVTAQIDAVFEELPVSAVKIGMLAGSTQVESVVAALLRHDPERRLPVVLDPVLRATNGGVALDEDGLQRLRTGLLPRATLVKPNLFEAACLLGSETAENRHTLRQQAQQLAQRTGCGIYLSGGHLGGEDVTDVLIIEDRLIELPGERWPGGDVHGSGCTLTAAIAAFLARENDLETAARRARDCLSRLFAASKQTGANGRAVSFDHATCFDRRD